MAEKKSGFSQHHLTVGVPIFFFGDGLARPFGRFLAAVSGTGVVLVAALAALLAGVGPVAAAPADPAALRSFAMAFDAWLTELYGCPARWRSTAECRPELGRFDADGWLRSRRAAARLFGLREE